MPVITTALLLGLPPEIGPLTRAGERPHRLKIYMVAISPVLGPVHVGRIVPARVVRSSEFVINVHSMPRTNGLNPPGLNAMMNVSGLWYGCLAVK
jgi:hypothetical protein